MPSLTVGIYCEGRTDWLILKALLCRILDRNPADVNVVPRIRRGGGFKHLAGDLPDFLRDFYERCVALVVVHSDNDGKVDLTRPGAPEEDPKHPRHAQHLGEYNATCRYCILLQKVEETRPRLPDLPSKDRWHWPVIVSVPVEAMESWLLTARALTTRGDGEFRAEELPAGPYLKRRFYGRPFIRDEDIRTKALPLIADSTLNLDDLAAYSPSFKMFLETLRSLNLV